MAGLKGTPEQRQALKAAIRRANQVAHIRSATESQDGHALVVAATQAAKAASRRIAEGADQRTATERQQRMARALIEVVDRFEAEAAR
jgi:hypothetical protein